MPRLIILLLFASRLADSDVPVLNVLFVSVCVPEFVVTVESISIDNVPAPSVYVASIPVPPNTRAPTMSSTLSAFNVTAPVVTVKSVALKLAIPLLEEVASSPLIVIVLFVTAVSIPSPAENVSVSVKRFTESGVPDYAEIESAVATVVVEAAVKRP